MNTVTRFTDRVENYVRYRPRYPQEVLTTLVRATGLRPEHVVADVGSGTGFLSELFVANGNYVLGIEPNAAMRAAGDEHLHDADNFSSVDGTAEATGLDGASVDYVVAGQAFHWFDAQKARAEFERILKPGGWAVLVWNSRAVDDSPFMAALYALVQRTAREDASKLVERNVDDENIAAFFGASGYGEAHFDNVQRLDREGLRGRTLSSSYAPRPDDAGYVELLEGLEALFARHAEDGAVDFVYDTRLYWGRFKQ